MSLNPNTMDQSVTSSTGATVTVIAAGNASACIKGSLGVRDAQKIALGLPKINTRSLGLPTFKDIPFITKI